MSILNFEEFLNESHETILAKFNRLSNIGDVDATTVSDAYNELQKQIDVNKQKTCTIGVVDSKSYKWADKNTKLITYDDVTVSYIFDPKAKEWRYNDDGDNDFVR